MNEIPKIIHQIWSGVDEPLPNHFLELGNTWKRDYSDWKYEFWDNDRMNNFIMEFYPQYWDLYNKYPFNVQRWDAIRYLILDKIGGMYVDFDYESIEPMDRLIEGKSCCFAMEPQAHCFYFRRRIMFNNALMFSIPKHQFMQKIINTIFSEKILESDKRSKDLCVLNTTGPLMLIELYETLSESEKHEIYLIPAKYVTPFDEYQATLLRMGDTGDDLEECLKDAYAVHYFFSNWRASNT